jgi:hypothetical protein
VKLSRLGSPGLTPLLSWVLLLRVGEILKVKTVRSIKAKGMKTGISSSCMTVIQVFDV